MNKVEEKLEHFSNEVLLKASDEKKHIIDSVNNEKKNILEKKELEYLEEAYNKIQNGLRRLDRQKNEIHSKAIMDGKRKLLVTRESIIKEVFENAEKKLINFTNTDDYKNYLIERIKKNLDAVGKGSIKIYVCANDERHLDELNKIFDNKVEINNNQNDMIGGCIIYNESNKVMVNDSLKENLLAQRESFMQMSKLEI